MYMCRYACMYVNMYTYIYVYLYICIHMYVFIYICINVYIYIHTCKNIFNPTIRWFLFLGGFVGFSARKRSAKSFKWSIKWMQSFPQTKGKGISDLRVARGSVVAPPPPRA